MKKYWICQVKWDGIPAPIIYLYYLEAVVEDDTGAEFSHLTDPDEFENFPEKGEVTKNTY